MKYILMLILSLSLFNCTNNKIKIDIEDGLSAKGIEEWARVMHLDISYNSYLTQIFVPDVCIFENTNLGKKGYILLGSTYWDGEDPKPKPVNIAIKTNDDVIIAHEFGHFLGLKDDHSNRNSIMYPAGNAYLGTDLKSFDEFK